MKLSPKLLGRAVLPAIAVGLIGFAILTVDPPEATSATPPAAPAAPSAGAGSVVAALGLVEPSSEVIAIASELPGVIRQVHVRAGDPVSKGDPLFSLDAREVEAQLASARAALGAAEARRVSAAASLSGADANAAAGRAAAANAEAAARDARARLGLFDQVSDPRAVSTDERDRARFAYERARAAADEAQARARAAGADAARARSGIVEADAAIREANARINELETTCARLTVVAPIAGEVLRLNARPGEFATAGPSSEPLVALGSVDPMHVRVQIDEEDIARVQAGAKAEGALRGDANRRVPLTFVRFEPQARPKTNLSGGAERVDTRVIEAIYAFDRTRLPAFVGQQMDVFVSARPIVAEAAPKAATP
jgi:HlyD family secretion protein